MRPAPYDLSISAARASAPFASPLQRPDEPGARQIRRAIAAVIGVCGVRGCAAPTRGSGHRRGPSTGEDGAGGAAGRARRRRGEPGARPGVPTLHLRRPSGASWNRRSSLSRRGRRHYRGLGRRPADASRSDRGEAPCGGRANVFKSRSGPAVAINRLRHTAGIALSLPLMPRSEEEVLRWPVSAAASPTGNTDSADRIPELRRTLLRCVINPRMEQRTLPPLCVAIGILVLID